MTEERVTASEAKQSRCADRDCFGARARATRTGLPEAYLGEFVDRLRLVAGRLELGVKPERLLDVALRALGDEQSCMRLKISPRRPRCRDPNSLSAALIGVGMIGSPRRSPIDH
jgi:hypothetical protein